MSIQQLEQPVKLSRPIITLSAIMTVASRDVRKFIGDRGRIISTLIFPLLFVGVLGGSLQSNLGRSAGFNFLTFTFTGIFAQTLFQSTATGIISLVEDRENDFSQEMFIAPISRYAIVFGKILGESLVAIMQAIVIILFGFLILRIDMSPAQMLALLLVAPIVCVFGGAFGILMLSLFSSQRSANQIFPFLIFPQFFLAGVFTPIKILPPYLDILSRITPMRYAVDLTRNFFYVGQPDYDKVVLANPLLNLLVIGITFAVFLVIGTLLFVRSERNR